MTALAIAVLGYLSAGGAPVARDLPNQLGLTGEAARLVRDAVDAASNTSRSRFAA